MVLFFKKLRFIDEIEHENEHEIKMKRKKVRIKGKKEEEENASLKGSLLHNQEENKKRTEEHRQ